jgi:hypothetical protein
VAAADQDPTELRTDPAALRDGVPLRRDDGAGQWDAYGDLVAAALAFASILALRKNWGGAIPLVWVANIWGFVDLLNGFRGVLELNVPQFDLATLWYVYTFYAPIVIVAHVLIFMVLLKPDLWKKATAEG